MTCEYPDCSHSIESVCTNHCQWSLCHDHLSEHQQALLWEFEHALEDLIRPTNELAKSIDQTKKICSNKQRREIERMEQSHQQQLDQIEQQLNELNKYQNQFNQISECLIEMKKKDKILKQEDFHQLDILTQEIHRLENSFQSPAPPPPPRPIPDRCPLTSLNIFGLSSSHHVRLCSLTRKPRNLFEHLRNYHHLTPFYANQLLDVLQRHLDPMQTIVFPPNTQVIVFDDKQPCVYYETSIVNDVPSKSCATMVTKKFLPIHLKTVHRLRSIQIQQVLQGHSDEM